MPRILVEWGDGDRRWGKARDVLASSLPPTRGEDFSEVEGQPHPQPQVETPIGDTARDRAWANIEETQERLISAIRAGDTGPDVEAKRFWLGGAIATFALLTGQDGNALNRSLAEKYPIPTYQGMQVRDPHKTLRPEPHPGRQRPVDPNEAEVDVLGVEIGDDAPEAPE